jgi:hypothetical protein
LSCVVEGRAVTRVAADAEGPGHSVPGSRDLHGAAAFQDSLVPAVPLPRGQPHQPVSRCRTACGTQVGAGRRNGQGHPLAPGGFTNRIRSGPRPIHRTPIRSSAAGSRMRETTKESAGRSPLREPVVRTVSSVRLLSCSGSIRPVSFDADCVPVGVSASGSADLLGHLPHRCESRCRPGVGDWGRQAQGRILCLGVQLTRTEACVSLCVSRVCAHACAAPPTAGHRLSIRLFVSHCLSNATQTAAGAAPESRASPDSGPAPPACSRTVIVEWGK